MFQKLPSVKLERFIPLHVEGGREARGQKADSRRYVALLQQILTEQRATNTALDSIGNSIGAALRDLAAHLPRL